MQGKVIDRAAFTLLFTTALYLFFLNAWRSIPLACALAFIACLLLDYVIRRRPVRMRLNLVEAEHMLYRVACLPAEEARALLEPLARATLPGAERDFHLVLKHPDAALNVNDLFTLWKETQGREAVILAATCPADARALAYAEDLRNPRIEVLDRRRLVRLLRDHPLALPEEAAPPRSLKARLRGAARRLLGEPPRPRQLLLAAGLLAGYCLGGSFLYLPFGLLTLARFCAAIIFRRGQSVL